jgi:putative helicase MOV10L1
MSDVAAKCGLSLSLLERLMSLPLYSRNETKFPDEKYNPIVLTKLVKNYRAHPTLLKLPSKLFYDDELESAAAEEDTNLCHSLDFLKGKGVPLLFHGIQGKSARDPDSPSWFNAAEVIEVVNYVRKLRAYGLSNDEIGIITPYRKQVGQKFGTIVICHCQV